MPGNEGVIMFADTTAEFTARPAGIFIYITSLADTYKKVLAIGAVSTMEPTQKPYVFTCGFKDAYGNNWWPTEGQ